jgi:hypothetical protein
VDDVIVDDIEQRACPDRTARVGQETAGAPGSAGSEVSTDLGDVITLRVGSPLTPAAISAMDERVRALIARGAGGIVLDVVGTVLDDDLSAPAFSAVSRAAADAGVTLVLADPSSALRERLRQQGVRGLTFAYRSEPSPTADEEPARSPNPPPAVPSEVSTDRASPLRRPRTPVAGPVRGAQDPPHPGDGRRPPPSPSGTTRLPRPRPPLPPPHRDRGVLDTRGGAPHDCLNIPDRRVIRPGQRPTR